MAFNQAAYSFLDLVCIVAGIPLYGFADGNDAIIVKRRNPVGTLTVGSDGFGTFAKNADKSYEITIKLMDTSPSNAVLQDILDTSDFIGTVFVPVQIQNLSALDSVNCAGATVSVQPDLQAGKDSNVREWVLVTNAAEVYIGGTLQI